MCGRNDLVAHDAKRGTDLLGALATYFAHSCNVAGTARALHIRTTTLLKRIERIGSLLGHDWQQPDHALRLQLAVHLHDLAGQVEPVEQVDGKAGFASAGP